MASSKSAAVLDATARLVETIEQTTGGKLEHLNRDGFPPEAFAVVKDADNPKTWKSLLWADPDGSISAPRVHAAMGALKRMPEEVAKAAAPRIAAAYVELFPDRVLPKSLADAAVVDDAGDDTAQLDHGVLVPYNAAKSAMLPDDVADAMFAIYKQDLSPVEIRAPFEDAIGEITADEIVPCMIGFGLPAQVATALAVPDSDDVLAQDPADMHVTLAYVRIPAGRMSQALTLVAAAMRAACTAYPFTAEITGFGIFVPETDDDGDAPLAPGESDGDADSDGPWWTAVALIDSVNLNDLRADLIERLNAAGLPVDDYTHGFVPHITIATAQAEAPLKTIDLPTKQSWTVDAFCVAVGDAVMHFPLIGGWAEPDDDEPMYGMAIARSDDKQRYTFAPLYVPGRVDTHKEWITRERLQETQWDFVQRACDGEGNVVNLQHYPNVEAGRWVDIVCWPYPTVCELVTGGGVRKSVEVPADTIWMGVRWEEWAYDRVEADELNGLSLEGFALY